MKKQTQAIHQPYKRRDAYDALSMPVYNAVAFEFDNAKVMADAFCGRIDAPDYSRVENPTVTNLFTVKSSELKGQDPTQNGFSLQTALSLRPSYTLGLRITF